MIDEILKPKRRSYIAQLKYDLEHSTSDDMRAEISSRIAVYKSKKSEYYKANKHIWNRSSDERLSKKVDE